MIHNSRIQLVTSLCHTSHMFAARLLADIAIAAVSESRPGITETESGQIQVIVANESEGRITYDKAAELFQDQFHTIGPINKIRVILEVAETPLPDLPAGSEVKSTRSTTRQWSRIEDLRLLAGIRKFGIDNWLAVAQFVGNSRSRSQCSQRWYRSLDPRISRLPWNDIDDARLLSLVEMHGEKAWSTVSTKIGNRSDVQCRFRYQQLRNAAALNRVRKEDPGDRVSPCSFLPAVQSSQFLIGPGVPSSQRPEPEHSMLESIFDPEKFRVDFGEFSESDAFWMFHP
jgi:hypothetical protein